MIYPFTDPKVNPLTICFCANAANNIIGIIDIMALPVIPPQFIEA
jgi:hypothetical protein